MKLPMYEEVSIGIIGHSPEQLTPKLSLIGAYDDVGLNDVMDKGSTQLPYCVFHGNLQGDFK